MTSHSNESGTHRPTEIFVNKVEASGYSQNAMDVCINNCLEAFKATTQLIPHCLSMGGVHAFPGHIACDSASRSEVVVPLLRAAEVIGVLDLDSPSLGRFDADDAAGLEALAQLFVLATDLGN